MMNMGTAVFGIGVAAFGLIVLAFLASAAWEIIKLFFRLVAGFFSKSRTGDLPVVRVNEFDFWDLPLIFLKEYMQGNDEPETPVKSAELCYRDMFKAGAIKIQMGSQKTMFYIPEERGIVHPPLRELQKNSVDTDRYCLVPADWEPFYEGINSKSSKLREPARIEISITGDTADIDWRYIDSALRKVFVIDRTVSYSINPDNGSTNMRFIGQIPNDG